MYVKATLTIILHTHDSLGYRIGLHLLFRSTDALFDLFADEANWGG